MHASLPCYQKECNVIRIVAKVSLNHVSLLGQQINAQPSSVTALPSVVWQHAQVAGSLAVIATS